MTGRGKPIFADLYLNLNNVYQQAEMGLEVSLREKFKSQYTRNILLYSSLISASMSAGRNHFLRTKKTDSYDSGNPLFNEKEIF